ncbi:leucine--tRNA ligase, mitochondrial [Anthonomus grandis grandis]|uniref:leucine--tRNA ligase, mitochondrial n=1 Tax=Anthonomus grandis grandis TaxID=2921223 RepID=UPI002165181D|nr:leucine--tRNA ligase, mitochondrial [Anthonomus grandis grandis]
MGLLYLTQNSIKHLNRVSPHLNKRCLSGLHLWNEDISRETKIKIEKHWRDKIKQKPFDENDNTREKYYVNSMFPYPSGFLHMGHVRVYTISDTVARYQHMNNKNVIHPIGWDAFGLPAENAAIDRQLAPEEWTKKNIAHMKQQLQRLGCCFEWNREIATCDPQYYRWTQDLFLKLYDAGLAYQKEALVNWDPVDQTVLADEQVDENGCSWRSGAKVEKKLLKQWFIRTTKFAKQLYDELNESNLQDWRDIILLQKHWIGDCNGVNFDFNVETEKNIQNTFITLWTSTPEHIEEAKFIALTDNHILAKKESVKTNGGTVKLKAKALNPFNNEYLPIFVTEEIKFLDRTDSFIGIPVICQQSSDFARLHNIPITSNKTDSFEPKIKQQEILEKATKLNAGGYWSSAKLRDWLISRQRYWGTPIPIIHCDTCGTVPVPRESLPVKLPQLSQLTNKGKSPLEDVHEWVNTECPKCGNPAKRETDTMDTFVDSSWYFLRYIDPKNDREMFSKEKAFKMMPVDLYIGGKEHAVLHLYYARFVSHFLHSLGLLPEKEPFKRLLVQGMVMGRSYRLKGSGQYLPEEKVNIIDMKKGKATHKETGEPVIISWEKMSKSKCNGVAPEDMFMEYGIDTTRLLVMADVAPTSHRNWNSNTFPGILNWQKRLWLTIRDFLRHRSTLPPKISDDKYKAQEDYLWDSRNYYVKGASFNYVISQQISVAISKQQGLTNSIRRAPPALIAHSLQYERSLAAQIILLAPLAPHFASELWSGFTSAPNRINNTEEIRWDKNVLEQKWPETDMDYELDLVCKVNGYENCTIKFPRGDLAKLSKEDAIKVAMSRPEVQLPLKIRNILDVEFQVHEGFEGVINFLTDQPPPKKKIEATSDS